MTLLLSFLCKLSLYLAHRLCYTLSDSILDSLLFTFYLFVVALEQLLQLRNIIDHVVVGGLLLVASEELDQLLNITLDVGYLLLIVKLVAGARYDLVYLLLVE